MRIIYFIMFFTLFSSAKITSLQGMRDKFDKKINKLLKKEENRDGEFEVEYSYSMIQQGSSLSETYGRSFLLGAFAASQMTSPFKWKITISVRSVKTGKKVSVNEKEVSAYGEGALPKMVALEIQNAIVQLIRLENEETKTIV